MELGFLFAAFADTTTYSFARKRLGFPFVRFVREFSDLCVFGPLLFFFFLAMYRHDHVREGVDFLLFFLCFFQSCDSRRRSD